MVALDILENVWVLAFGLFLSHMWFSSGWLKRLIWQLCENLHFALQLHQPTTTSVIHLHRSEISPHLSHSLARLWEAVINTHTCAHTRWPSDARRISRYSRDWLLSLCQVLRINCSLRHSCFCLFTLCSAAVTSPYYLYVHFFLLLLYYYCFPCVCAPVGAEAMFSLLAAESK